MKKFLSFVYNLVLVIIAVQLVIHTLSDVFSFSSGVEDIDIAYSMIAAILIRGLRDDEAIGE